MRLIVLCLFAEVFREVAEDRRGIRGPSFKSRDAARAAPAVAAFHAHDDVLVKKSAFLEEAHRGFRREFVGSEFAYADQITKTFSLFRLREFQEWIKTMHFAFC